jgi:type IV secretion system protein VirB9
MIRYPLAVVLLAFAGPLHGQVQPQPGGGDPHLQVVDYREGQVIQLRGAPGYQLMLELSPDEQVQSVALGDSGAWQVSASKAGDRLFLKPVVPNSTTNMTVVTSVRVYAFDLAAASGASPEIPYTVQFRYPAPKAESASGQYVDVAAVSRRLSKYRIGGDRLLRPTSVSDDGQHTYIAWPSGVAIPAVYAPDRTGHEMLLNGMMGTDDVYVVDGVPQRLIFRIDREVASAERINRKKGR